MMCSAGMIDRPRSVQRLHALFDVFPVVSLLGARQVGKSTLARQFAAGSEITSFDAEIPAETKGGQLFRV